MNVKLLSMSGLDDVIGTAEDVLVTASSQCYKKKFDISDALEMTEDAKNKLLKKIISSGHTSVTEHISFTFLVEDVSRALTHQLVRHRIGCSYSQRSGRYTGLEDGNWYVVPHTINTEEKLNVFVHSMNTSKDAYLKLCELGVPKEDARYLLPNGQFTNIAVTMNCRALQNFFSERMCSRAQWEIRELANEMAKICKQKLPIVFEECKFAYPKCVQIGFCSEEKCCGRMPKKSEIL